MRLTQTCGGLQPKQFLPFHLSSFSILAVTDDHGYVQKRGVCTEFKIQIFILNVVVQFLPFGVAYHCVTMRATGGTIIFTFPVEHE